MPILSSACADIADPYLRSTPIIDWDQADVSARARELAGGEPTDVARRCFEWVRDTIRHSTDHQLDEPTCAASETLAARGGLCYAKSHLLAALLRANAIPAGFCYQRLSQDGNGAPFCLHGLVAVKLPKIGWYRIDPRGNRAGVNAQFSPPIEQLAFLIQHDGEADLPEIWADPLPIVTEALRSCRSLNEIMDHLPDVPLAAIGRTAVQSGGAQGRGGALR
jgi:transglutaminase-like putative cysteine protease